MSNLEDRNAARTHDCLDEFGPKYPNLDAAVAKHRRLNDDTPEGRKAYGQAVLKAINALNRQKLTGASGPVNPRSPCASGTWHSEGKDILKAIRQQHRAATQAAANGPTFARTEDELECDYYRAMLKSRGIDPDKIETLVRTAEQCNHPNVWLKAAWNVIKTKRGTPYLAEAKAEPAPQPEAIEPAPQTKKRGRPFGSKNKPEADAETYMARIKNPAKQRYARNYALFLRNGGEEPKLYGLGPLSAQSVRMRLAELIKPEPKPSKPRVPSHYLSSASSVAYHAAM
jgi:hypothetical protein